VFIDKFIDQIIHVLEVARARSPLEVYWCPLGWCVPQLRIIGVYSISYSATSCAVQLEVAQPNWLFVLS